MRRKGEKLKRFSAAFAASVMLLATSSAFASGASYSVHDDEVRSTLSEIKSQVDTIQKYLKVVKEKEKSMDLMDKAAMERQNDSMTKLTGNLSNGFVGDLGQGQNVDKVIEAIGGANGGFGGAISGNGLSLGKHNFLGDFTKVLSGELKLTNDEVLALKIFTEGPDDYLDMFSGILNGIDSTDPDTIKTVYVQNLQELSAKKQKLTDEADEMCKKIDERRDQSDQRVKDIGEAKDTKADGKDALWGNLGNLSSILSTGGAGAGEFDFGSVLNPTDAHTIFVKEGTESQTAAQERTTLAVSTQLAHDSYNDQKRAIRARLAINCGQIDAIIQLNDLNLTIALGNAESTRIKSLPVAKNGTKHKPAFEGIL